MKVKVLGCHGGETPNHKTTCFMIDNQITIDAGAICRSLELVEQVALQHILVSHSHMDHVKDLALLADQIIGQKKQPIFLHCGAETAETLRSSYFNNFLWPDFTVIPTPEAPVMKIIIHEPETPFRISLTEPFSMEAKPSEGPLADDEYEITYVPLTHPVESMAMLIRSVHGTILYSSDTGPTKRLWELANRIDDIKGMFVELSFPNNMQPLADVAGHYTPATLAKELTKVDGRDDIPLFVYHLKPSFYQKTLDELEALELKNMHLVELQDEFQFR
jgi:cAMP phosphodiesterase